MQFLSTANGKFRALQGKQQKRDAGFSEVQGSIILNLTPGNHRKIAGTRDVKRKLLIYRQRQMNGA
jgi:hypothetical protein